MAETGDRGVPGLHRASLQWRLWVQGPINLCSVYGAEIEAPEDSLRLDTVHADCSDHFSEVLSPQFVNAQGRNILNLEVKALSTRTHIHAHTGIHVCIVGFSEFARSQGDSGIHLVKALGKNPKLLW